MATLNLSALWSSSIRLFCVGFVSLALVPRVAAADPAPCSILDLQARRLEPPPVQYADFCLRQPEACIVTGSPVLGWTPTLWALLSDVNSAVNAEVRLVSDIECVGREEFWSYPQKGEGDCEDFALEKRRRLVGLGIPSASLTMAIVHHRTEYFPHAVLLVETDAGTWALDNLYDMPQCWKALPYRFERRERTDGLWVRYSPN